MVGKLLKNLQNITNDNLKSITGMDATFLYAETPTSPMHVGSVNVLEGALEYETFKSIIKSRIHMVPKLRQRLIYVPMSIDYPYWVDDPNFDINMHLNHIALPKPGGWKQLRYVASHIFSQPLDQSRPLWSFTFVEGLDSIPQVPKGSVAIISRIHHVAIDGVAGAGILGLLYDMSPDKKEIPPPKPYNPAPIPNDLSVILQSTKSFAENPLKLPKLISQTLSASVKAGVLTRIQSAEMPTAPFSAPLTSLNGIISPRRKWNAAILSLDRVKALKKIMGTTLNDVILGICAGALRRYFKEKEKLPRKPLVAMVPVSTRTEKEKSETGNQISSMLIQLATNIEDPIERLEAIHENTVRGKSYQNALGAKTLAKMAESVPFGVANQAARLYSRYKLSALHNPAFNLTITNVPGPQFPLYLNGHKLLSLMGMAPVIDGMGLIITVFSYNGLITLSPTSDMNSMPDLDVFTRYLRESANELEAVILDLEKKGKKEKSSDKPKAAVSDVVFENIKKYLKDNPDAVKPNSGIFQFDILGDLPTNWKVDLNKSPGQVRKSKASKPDATFIIKDEHLMKIATGKLKVQTAFIQGRLKIKGDSAKAMKLGQLLGKVLKKK